MSAWMYCTLPSPSRNSTPTGCMLAKASASVTLGLFGAWGPQWPSTRAAEPSTADGDESRLSNTPAPVTAPVQVVSDMLWQRSLMKNVLLSPSVISLGLKQ